MLHRGELAWWLSNVVPRANYMMYLLPRQESLQAAYFRLWLYLCSEKLLCMSSWSLVNFQSVGPMPVHTTLSASLLWLVAWHFPCLPSIKTLCNEAQNCNLSLALLVYFTSSYLEILLMWEQLLAVDLQLLSTLCFFKAYFGPLHKCFPVLVGWTEQVSASYQTWRLAGAWRLKQSMLPPTFQSEMGKCMHFLATEFSVWIQLSSTGTYHSTNPCPT